MTTRRVNMRSAIASAAVMVALVWSAPSAHHSFAMYDQKKVVTLTGAITQFVPQANHAAIHFILFAPDHKSLAKGPDGKYVEWAVEMVGVAQLAKQDVTSKTYGPGTVFSVHLNPLRGGSNFGARIGTMARCPIDAATKKPKLPEPGKHCDSVPGHTLSGGTTF